MTLRSRLAGLEKAAQPPEPRPGDVPAWFADKVLAFCRQLYRNAGLDPDAARLAERLAAVEATLAEKKKP
jgi:hypothetical protein